MNLANYTYARVTYAGESICKSLDCGDFEYVKFGELKVVLQADSFHFCVLRQFTVPYEVAMLAV